MNAQGLIHTVQTLVADDKGLLAMDESNTTCNKRFAKLGIPQTEETRLSDEFQIQVATALGVGVFVCPCHPATGSGAVAREEVRVLAAQQALYHRARFNRAARRGGYNAEMEKEMRITTNVPQLTKTAA